MLQKEGTSIKIISDEDANVHLPSASPYDTQISEQRTRTPLQELQECGGCLADISCRGGRLAWKFLFPGALVARSWAVRLDCSQCRFRIPAVLVKALHELKAEGLA